MSTWKMVVLGAMIPLTLAVPALAQDRDGPRMVFEELDLNSDGVITLEEMLGQADVRFAQADTDGDGALSRDELLARGQDRAEARIDRMIERADENGDGVLSQDELAEMRDGRRGPNPERIFERMDDNSDGQISPEEFQAAADRFMERRMGGGHRDRG